MERRRVRGVLSGLPPLLVHAAIGPSPAEDPGGWGPCAFWSFFPVGLHIPRPLPPYYCLDCYECVVSPQRVIPAALVFVAVCMASGAATVAMARTQGYLLGGLPVLLFLPIMFVLRSWQDTFDLRQTIVLGLSILGSSVLAALVGAYGAARMA